MVRDMDRGTPRYVEQDSSQSLREAIATTAGLRGYLRYFEHPQVHQIFSDTGYWRIAVETVRCLPDVLRVWARSRRLSSRWPWPHYERFLDQSLSDVRRQFNIRVV